MRNVVSKYFNDSFDLSHAAFISIVVHFMFFATQPFGIFDKPLVQEKEYKKIRLEVVKKPEVVRVPQKKLEVKRQVLRKKLVLPTPVAIPVSTPIRQIESVPMQVTRSMVTPVMTKASKNYYQTASSPVGKVVVGKFVAKGTFNRNSFQPRTRMGKVDKLKQSTSGHSTFVDTRGGVNHSFNPQVRNVAALNLDKQDQLSGDELDELWNGYTTTVRQMIARAKIYPPMAREKGQQGKINLSFKLGKDGGVLKLLVKHSSGHAMLDEAARNAVKNAGPFPPIPEKLNKQYVLLKLPVSFILR